MDIIIVSLIIIFLLLGMTVSLMINNYNHQKELYTCLVMLDLVQQHRHFDELKVEGLDVYIKMLNESLDKIKFIEHHPFSLVMKDKNVLELRYKFVALT